MWFLSQALMLAVVGTQLLPDVAPSAPGAVLTIPGPNWIQEVPLWSPALTLFKYVFPPFDHLNYTLFIVDAAVFTVAILLYNVFKGKAWLLAIARGVAADIRNTANKNSGLLLCSLWLIMPIVLPFIVSKVFKPIYVDRYTIAASPALYLLLALGIWTARRAVPQLLSIAALAVVIVPGLQQYYALDVKEQWRDVAAYVQERGRSGDVIVIAPDNASGDRLRAFNWYYRGDLRRCQLMTSPAGDEAIARAVEECVSGHDRVWLILRNVPEHILLFSPFFAGRQDGQMQLLGEELFTGYRVHLLAVKGS